MKIVLGTRGSQLAVQQSEELVAHLLALRQVCLEPYVLPGISALAGLAMLLDQSDRAEHYRRADPHSSTNLPASEAPTTS